MTILRSFRRLLHVRNMEEENARISLDAALRQLNELQAAAENAQHRDQEGRRMVKDAIQQGVWVERISGLEDSRCAAHRSLHLQPQIDEAKASVSMLRQELTERRLARRQAETILHGADIKIHQDAMRRMQQANDEQFLSRLEHAKSESDKAPVEVKKHRQASPES